MSLDTLRVIISLARGVMTDCLRMYENAELFAETAAH